MAKAATKLKEPEQQDVGLRSLARESLEAAGGDTDKATDALIARVTRSKSLFASLTERLVYNACHYAVRMENGLHRHRVWNSDQTTAQEQKGRVVALARGTANTLMDFPLPGGTRLADAYKGDVEAASEFYLGQASDMKKKGNWLQLISQHMPKLKTVSEVMDNARLAELRAEASKDKSDD